MIYNLSKNLNILNTPSMVKNKKFYSTDIESPNRVDLFWQEIKDFVPPTEAIENQDNAVKINFPYLIQILYGIGIMNSDKEEKRFVKVTPEQFKFLYKKCDDIIKKSFILTHIQVNFFQPEKKPWYYNENFYENEKKEMFFFDAHTTDYETLNRYVSWSVKRYHNLIFKDLQSTMNEVEIESGINKSYSQGGDNLSEDDIILLKKYIKNTDKDSQNGVKALHVNARYIINLFCNDANFKKGLTLYDDSKNKKNLTKQILRYIQEIIIYFRLVNFYEHLVKIGKIEQHPELKNFISDLSKKMSSPIEYYKPFLNLSKISNKSSDKIIELLNDADKYYVDVISDFVAISK